MLTSDGKAVDTSKLRSAIDQADSLQSAEYPMDEWDKMLTLLDKAKQALASDPSTQNEVDAPQRALSLQLAQLAVDRQSGDGGNPGGGDQTGDGNQSGNGDQTGDGGQQQSSTADDNSSELSSTGSSVTPWCCLQLPDAGWHQCHSDTPLFALKYRRSLLVAAIECAESVMCRNGGLCECSATWIRTTHPVMLRPRRETWWSMTSA